MKILLIFVLLFINNECRHVTVIHQRKPQAFISNPNPPPHFNPIVDIDTDITKWIDNLKDNQENNLLPVDFFTSDSTTETIIPKPTTSFPPITHPLVSTDNLYTTSSVNLMSSFYSINTETSRSVKVSEQETVLENNFLHSSLNYNFLSTGYVTPTPVTSATIKQNSNKEAVTPREDAKLTTINYFVDSDDAGSGSVDGTLNKIKNYEEVLYIDSLNNGLHSRSDDEDYVKPFNDKVINLLMHSITLIDNVELESTFVSGSGDKYSDYSDYESNKNTANNLVAFGSKREFTNSDDLESGNGSGSGSGSINSDDEDVGHLDFNELIKTTPIYAKSSIYDLESGSGSGSGDINSDDEDVGHLDFNELMKTTPIYAKSSIYDLESGSGSGSGDINSDDEDIDDLYFNKLMKITPLLPNYQFEFDSKSGSGSGSGDGSYITEVDENENNDKNIAKDNDFIFFEQNFIDEIQLTDLQTSAIFNENVKNNKLNYETSTVGYDINSNYFDKEKEIDDIFPQINLVSDFRDKNGKKDSKAHLFDSLIYSEEIEAELGISDNDYFVIIDGYEFKSEDQNSENNNFLESVTIKKRFSQQQ